MPFEIHITPADQTFLDGLPLSPQAKARFKLLIAQHLANVKDISRNDPANRQWPGQPLFMQDMYLIDYWADDIRWHRIEFTIDDSQASQGKLTVVFVDHTDGAVS